MWGKLALVVGCVAEEIHCVEPEAEFWNKGGLCSSVVIFDCSSCGFSGVTCAKDLWNSALAVSLDHCWERTLYGGGESVLVNAQKEKRLNGAFDNDR